MKRLLFAGVAVALLCFTGQARADLELVLKETGFADQSFTFSGNLGSPGLVVNFGDFTIQFLSIKSNSPGTSGLADTRTASLSVVNNNGTTQTLTVVASGNDFTQPSGSNLALTDKVSGTVNSGGIVTAFEQGFASNTNALLDTSGSSTGGSTSTGTATFGSSSSGTFTPLGKYSLTSQLQFTVSGNGELGFSVEEDVSPGAGPGGGVVPEPSGLALVGFGVLGLAGVGAYRRFRRPGLALA
jgi:hypothetical protein